MFEKNVIENVPTRVTHFSLYRQIESYARERIKLEQSILPGWVGGTSELCDTPMKSLPRCMVEPLSKTADDSI